MDCMDEHDIQFATSLNIDDESERDTSSHGDSSSSSNNSLNNYLAIPPPVSPPGQPQPTNLPLLTACYISALTVGATTYAFSFYSNDLKTSLDLSQNQLDTLSSATFCAGIFSWLPGMVVDAWGARRAMALGGTSNAIMLSLYWAIATEHLKVHDIEWLIFMLSALSVVTFMGCALITGSVFKVIVESCACGTKGKAVGCAKGYVGVGSGVYVCLFGAFFGNSSEGGGSGSGLGSLNFLLMAAALSFLAATLPALLFLPKQSPTSSTSVYRSRSDGTRRIHFFVVYLGLISLGLWVVGSSLMELHADEQAISGGARGVDPSILNKTLLQERDSMLLSDGSDLRMVRESSRILTSSSTEISWGNAFVLMFLWWGPPLSLLCLSPGREFAGDSIISPEDGAPSSVDCDDDNDINNLETEGVNGSLDSGIDVEEEDAFSHNGLPTSIRVSFGLKNCESERGVGGDHVLDARDRGFTLLQMLRTSPAWLMAWTYVILVSTTSTFVSADFGNKLTYYMTYSASIVISGWWRHTHDN